MAEQLQIPEAVKKLIGVESRPVAHEIERGAIRRFVEAIGDPNPRWQQEAPPTFLSSLRGGGGPTALISELGIPYTHSLNGGDEWEYFKPVRAGDVIIVQSKIADATLRSGRLGPTLSILTEITYKNQRGELVAKAGNTFIHY